MNLLKNLAIDAESSHLDQILTELITYTPKTVLSLTAATAAGFITTFILAAGIKKLTHNYFMFIRFPIAAFIGFGVFTAIYTFVTELNEAAYESMVLDGITPLSHFLALILAAVVPLYILRLFMGLFRGWARDDESETTKAKSMFKGAEPEEEIMAEEKPSLHPTPQPAAPIIDEDEKEDTWSQKIQLESKTGTS